MKPVWTQIVGPPSSRRRDRRLDRVRRRVGLRPDHGARLRLVAVAPATATLRWVAPVADGAHWGKPVAVANGVVYTVDFTGFLDAYDARDRRAARASGRLLLGGASSPASLAWGGVSIARNTIYAAVGMLGLADGFVVAFKPRRRGRPARATSRRPPAAVAAAEAGGAGGGAGRRARSSPGPGAASTSYATPVMITAVGGPLSFVNLDIAQHDVVAEDQAPDGTPLFRSRLSGIGEIVPVEGLDRVESGRQYSFYCSIHPGMRGTLLVR